MIHSLLLQQPNPELEDHPLSADTKWFTENVFIRNLNDSPRPADAEHNQHGTTDGDTQTKTLYTREASNLLCWETGKLSALQFEHPHSASCRSASTATVTGCAGVRREVLCVIKLPC